MRTLPLTKYEFLTRSAKSLSDIVHEKQFKRRTVAPEARKQRGLDQGAPPAGGIEHPACSNCASCTTTMEEARSIAIDSTSEKFNNMFEQDTSLERNPAAHTPR